MNKDFGFFGGAGDFFIKCYNSDLCEQLEDKNCVFNLYFGNPTRTVHEFFNEHPNLKNFNIIKLYEQYSKLKEDPVHLNPLQIREKLIEDNNIKVSKLNPKRGELIVYSSFNLPKEEYAVVHPFSSTKGRILNNSHISDILKRASESFEKVFLMCKSSSTYQNHKEDFRITHPNVELFDKELNHAAHVVKNCNKFYGTDSAFSNIAARENIDCELISRIDTFNRRTARDCPYLNFYKNKENVKIILV